MFNKKIKDIGTIPASTRLPPPPPLSRHLTPLNQKQRDAAKKIIPILIEYGITIKEVDTVLEYVQCFVREQRVSMPKMKEIEYIGDLGEVLRVTVDG